MNKTRIAWARFWLNVEKTPTCWLWKAGCFSNGYGQFRFAGKKLKAHRLSFLLEKGEIPEGLILRHTCDNPKCVNPDHLIFGTHKDNAQDRELRGRGLKGRKSGRDVSGSKNPASKITMETANEIRGLWPKESYSKLSIKFKISSSQIANIINGRSWKP